MGRFLIRLLLIIGLSPFLSGIIDALEEKPITIILRSYNNKDWYHRNLDSILFQQYDNYRILFYDDASPDGTGALVEDYLREKDINHRVTLFRNTERVGSLANLFMGASECHPDEIILDMDGDDWLPHNDVLAYLNQVYSNPEVWITYGSYLNYPDNSPGIACQIPQEIIDQNSIRDHGGYISHLRTYYASLFHKINTDDLLYDGEFMRVAQDVAYMIPMLEMSGKHSQFIPEILYIYNRVNPISDDRVSRNLQRSIDSYIRAKEKYLPIEKL